MYVSFGNIRLRETKGLKESVSLYVPKQERLSMASKNTRRNTNENVRMKGWVWQGTRIRSQNLTSLIKNHSAMFSDRKN